jgi:hypothetical protein
MSDNHSSVSYGGSSIVTVTDHSDIERYVRQEAEEIPEQMRSIVGCEDSDSTRHCVEISEPSPDLQPRRTRSHDDLDAGDDISNLGRESDENRCNVQELAENRYVTG